MLKHDTNNNIQYDNSNWAYQIKTILDNLVLGNLWTQQENLNIYLPLINQRIFDQYYQSWYSNINNSQRLSSYCRYKQTFQIEKYLDSITERKYKIALFQFRLSSHKLEIERDCYFNIPKTEENISFVQWILLKMNSIPLNMPSI